MAPNPGDLPPGRPRWNEIHRTLDRALACCRLNPHEQIIMQVARERSYAVAKAQGMTQAASFTINVSEVARDFGANRPNLSRALGRLVATGLLAEIAPGRYRIEKDYRTWTGAHALTARQVRTADEGQTWNPRLIVPPECAEDSTLPLFPSERKAQS